MPRCVHVLLAICLVQFGCASTSVYLGADPGVHVSPHATGGEMPIDAELAGLLCVETIDMHGRVRDASFHGEPSGRALYLSVDVSGLIAQPHLGVPAEPAATFDARLAERRNKIIDVLLIVSDHNAETYLSRAFANRAALTTSRNVLRDLSLGATSGLAGAGSPLSSVIGLGGLALGSAVDEMNDSLYMGETFHAMEVLIRGARADLRRRIRERSRLPYAEYDIADVLADMRRYSEMCSVRFGLAKLREAAQAAATSGL